MRNNVLAGLENDLDYAYDPDNIAELIVDYNHYIGGRVGNGDLSAWLSMGYEHHPTSGDPRLDTSLLPRIDSLLRDSGVYVELAVHGPRARPGLGRGVAVS